MTDLPPPASPARASFWQGSGFEATKRLTFLMAITLFMLIPLTMIEGVIQERAGRKAMVATEIGEQWGPEQHIGGPVLVIPYDQVERRTKADGSQEQQTIRHFASFLPDESQWRVKATVEKRYKSIYEVLVYDADLHLTGTFAAPDFARWGIGSDQVRWHEASLAFMLSGIRGLRAVTVKLNDRPLSIEAGLLSRHPGKEGFHTDLNMAGPTALTVDATMSVSGHDLLLLQPLAGRSEIDIASNWPHPNFQGTPLPAARDIGATGFRAGWSVNHLATGIPLAWRDLDYGLDTGESSSIGVALAEPGNVHQQTDRVIKYGILVIGLTFGTIFIVGLLKRDRVHLMQYLLIGAAIALFYLLLLSLAEQIPFGWAYLVASLVDIAIVTWYAASTIRPVIGWLAGGVLAILHAYMFVLLQMESYSLLSGTIGLFIILLLIMIVTRKIDWYDLGGIGRRA